MRDVRQRCPECAEPILAEARRCPHCGAQREDPRAGATSPRSNKRLLVMTGLMLGMLIAFVALFGRPADAPPARSRSWWPLLLVAALIAAGVCWPVLRVRALGAARSMARQGDFDGAAGSLRKWIDGGAPPIFRAALAEVLTMAGRWEEALRAAEDAEAHGHPRDLVVDVNRAICLRETGRAAEALELLERVVPEHSSEPAVLGHFCLTLAALGRLDEARTTLSRLDEALGARPTCDPALDMFRAECANRVQLG